MSSITSLIVDEMLESSDEELVTQTFLMNAELHTTSFIASAVSRPLGGSVVGWRGNIDRQRLQGHQRLYEDYFAENPVYSDEQFRRRFRIRRPLFLRIVSAVEKANKYFVQKRDATKKLGLSALQKVTAAIRQLAYGTPADACDEYLRIGESTAIECLLEFCRTVNKVFSDEYLRYPTERDIQRLLKVAEDRGFPGMLGSLDCMHWGWKNCPTAWAGQYQGKEKEPTIILEAVISHDLWIWHAFFGMPGSQNDINVLDRSPLFTDLCEGRALPVCFQINNHNYDMGYYLADGIYSQYATLVQTISSPQGQKKQYYAKMQEAQRKDVERGFGVLQSQWAITKGPTRFWNKDDIAVIMKTCIILHNLIVEDERDEENVPRLDVPSASLISSQQQNEDFSLFFTRYEAVCDSTRHYQLRNDLIEHLWQNRKQKNQSL